FFKHMHGLADVLLIGDLDGYDGTGPLAIEVAEGADFAVGDHPELTGSCAVFGHPEPHFFNRTPGAADGNDIAHGDEPLKEQKEPGNHVLDQRLRSKAHRQADNPSPSNDRRRIDAQRAHDEYAGDEDGAILDDALEQRSDGFPLLAQRDLPP